MQIDRLDVAIINIFTAEPRIGVMEASRRLSVARATVQARLDRLHESGAIIGIVPQLDPGRFGFPVRAFCSLQIIQGAGHVEIARQLRDIPEITDLHTVSGSSDLMAAVVARSNHDLQRVIDAIMATGTILRSSSVVVLSSHFQNRTLPLMNAITDKTPADDRSRPGLLDADS